MGPGRKARDGECAASNPQDLREQYEKELKDLQECGEAMLELRARKKLQPLLGEDEK